MKKKLSLMVILTILNTVAAYGSEAEMGSQDEKTSNLNPWCGQYCMSFFTKTRSAKMVGKDHLSLAVKAQQFDWDMVKGNDDDYHGRASGQSKERLATTLCMKYGWAQDHHIALGVPYWLNDFDTGTPNNSQGVGNIYIFEKWNCIKETNYIPAVAADFWYYFPTGDEDRKLGTENGAYKITTEVSKAWKDFSLHLNPCYTWSEDDDAEVGEINGAILLTPCPDFWPAIEYNYIHKEHKGQSHDVVPGFIWKFAKGWSFKAAAVINIDSTFTDRDRLGLVLKLFYKR